MDENGNPVVRRVPVVSAAVFKPLLLRALNEVHEESGKTKGEMIIEQQVKLAIAGDSKALALILRLLGADALKPAATTKRDATLNHLASSYEAYLERLPKAIVTAESAPADIESAAPDITLEDI